MAPAFPLAKLASVLLKQISKPLANRLKKQAKTSHFFRTWICMPPAQLYHFWEVNIKMRMLNLGTPSQVPKLNEAMAIELGAELLGEGVVFVVAAGCIIAEYTRGVLKEREKEAAKAQRAEDVENRVYELEYLVSEQEARIKELSRAIYIQKKVKMAPPSSTPPSHTYASRPSKQHPPVLPPGLSSTNGIQHGDGCCDDLEPIQSAKEPSTLVDRALQEVKAASVLL